MWQKLHPNDIITRIDKVREKTFFFNTYAEWKVREWNVAFYYREFLSLDGQCQDSAIISTTHDDHIGSFYFHILHSTASRPLWRALIVFILVLQKCSDLLNDEIHFNIIIVQKWKKYPSLYRSPKTIRFHSIKEIWALNLVNLTFLYISLLDHLSYRNENCIRSSYDKETEKLNFLGNSKTSFRYWFLSLQFFQYKFVDEFMR